MKKRLLVAFAVSAVAGTSWAIWVEACDQAKQTTATAKTSVTALTASTKGECAVHAATASNNGCAMKSSNATASTASHDGCAMKSSAASASMAAGCAGKSTAATAYNSKQACALGAGMIGAPGCSDRDAVTASNSMRDACDACSQMVTCTSEMEANGVQTQIVPLKNG